MKRIVAAALMFAGVAAYADDREDARPGAEQPDETAARNISNMWRDFLRAADIGTIHTEDDQSGTGGSGGAGQVGKSNWQYMKESWEDFKQQSDLDEALPESNPQDGDAQDE